MVPTKLGPGAWGAETRKLAAPWLLAAFLYDIHLDIQSEGALSVCRAIPSPCQCSADIAARLKKHGGSKHCSLGCTALLCIGKACHIMLPCCNTERWYVRASVLAI